MIHEEERGAEEEQEQEVDPEQNQKNATHLTASSFANPPVTAVNPQVDGEQPQINPKVKLAEKPPVSTPAPEKKPSWLSPGNFGTIVRKRQTPVNSPAPNTPLVTSRDPDTTPKPDPETPKPPEETREPAPLVKPLAPQGRGNGSIASSLPLRSGSGVISQIITTIEEKTTTHTPLVTPRRDDTTNPVMKSSETPTSTSTKTPKVAKGHQVTIAERHYEHLGEQFDTKDLNVREKKGEEVYGYQLPYKRTEFNTEVVSNAKNQTEKDFSEKIQAANKALVTEIKGGKFGEPEPISVTPQDRTDGEITQIEIAGVTFNCDMQNKTVAFTPVLNPKESFGLVLPFVDEKGENMSEDHPSFRALVINYENGKIDTLDGYQDLKKEDGTGRAYFEVPANSGGKTEKFYAKVSMKDIDALHEGVNAHLVEEKQQYEKAAKKIQSVGRMANAVKRVKKIRIDPKNPIESEILQNKKNENENENKKKTKTKKKKKKKKETKKETKALPPISDRHSSDIRQNLEVLRDIVVSQITDQEKKSALEMEKDQKSSEQILAEHKKETIGKEYSRESMSIINGVRSQHNYSVQNEETSNLTPPSTPQIKGSSKKKGVSRV